jgi:LysM repeat protein
MNKSLLSHKLSTIIAVFILAALLVAPMVTLAQAGTVAVVNTGNINVRNGPSIAYKSLATLPYNTEVTLLGRADKTTWVYINAPGNITGWVNFIYMRSYARLDSLPITWNGTVPPSNNNPYTPPPATYNPGPRYHTVKQGETLKTIAAKYGTTWTVLAALNNIVNPNLIYAGQQILISGGTTTNPPPVTGGTRIHVVAAGETLQTIAAKYGTTWAAIATANNLSNPNYVFSGQRLIIPAGPPRAPQYYTVRPGDTLFSIALRYGVSAQTIVIANNLINPNVVYVGQTLTIP